MNTTDKRKAKSERYSVWLRNYQRVRGRALVRLAKENPERYKELFEEERVRDESEGKSWLDLSGRTSSSMGSAGSSNGQGGVPLGHTDSDETKARDLGAEA